MLARSLPESCEDRWGAQPPARDFNDYSDMVKWLIANEGVVGV